MSIPINPQNRLTDGDIVSVNVQDTPLQDFDPNIISHDFWINDLYFKVSPESITISEENNFAQVQAMRSNGADKFPVGLSSQIFQVTINIPSKSTITNIDVDYGDPTKPNVNTGKRGGFLDLLIQFKNIHFSVIENAYLRSKLRVPSSHNMVFCMHNFAFSVAPDSPDMLVGTLTISPLAYTPFSDRYNFKTYWATKKIESDNKVTNYLLEDVNNLNLLSGWTSYKNQEYITRNGGTTPPTLEKMYIDLTGDRPEATEPIAIDPKYLLPSDLHKLDQDVMIPPESLGITPYAHQSEPFKAYIDWLHLNWQHKVNGLGEIIDCTKISPYNSDIQNTGDEIILKWKEFKKIPIPSSIVDTLRKEIKNKINSNISLPEDYNEGIQAIRESFPSSVSNIRSDFKQGTSQSWFINLFCETSLVERIGQLGNVRRQSRGPEINEDGSLNLSNGEFRFHKGIDIFPKEKTGQVKIYFPWKFEVIKNDPTGRTGEGKTVEIKVLEGPWEGLNCVFMHLDQILLTTARGGIVEGPKALIGTVGRTGIHDPNVDRHLHLELKLPGAPDGAQYGNYPLLYRKEPKELLIPGQTNPNIEEINNYLKSLAELPNSPVPSGLTYENFIANPRKFLNTPDTATNQATIEILDRGPAAIARSANNDQGSKNASDAFNDYLDIVKEAYQQGWIAWGKDLTTFDLFYKEHKLSISCNSAVWKQTEEPLVCDFVAGNASNIIKKIPLQGIPTPTAQYLGREDDNFIIGLKGLGLNVVKKLEIIKDTLKEQALRFKYIPESWILTCENNFINAFGTNLFVLTGIDSTTIKGSPGLYGIEMRLLSHNTSLQPVRIKQVNKINSEDITESFKAELTNLYTSWIDKAATKEADGLILKKPIIEYTQNEDYINYLQEYIGILAFGLYWDSLLHFPDTDTSRGQRIRLPGPSRFDTRLNSDKITISNPRLIRRYEELADHIIVDSKRSDFNTPNLDFIAPYSWDTTFVESRLPSPNEILIKDQVSRSNAFLTVNGEGNAPYQEALLAFKTGLSPYSTKIPPFPCYLAAPRRLTCAVNNWVVNLGEDQNNPVLQKIGFIGGGFLAGLGGGAFILGTGGLGTLALGGLGGGLGLGAGNLKNYFDKKDGELESQRYTGTSIFEFSDNFFGFNFDKFFTKKLGSLYNPDKSLNKDDIEFISLDERNNLVRNDQWREDGLFNPSEEYSNYIFDYLYEPMKHNFFLNKEKIYNISLGTDLFPKTRDLIIASEQKQISPAYEDLYLPFHPFHNVNDLNKERGNSFTDPDFYLVNPEIDLVSLQSLQRIENTTGLTPKDAYNLYIDNEINYCMQSLGVICSNTNFRQGSNTDTGGMPTGPISLIRPRVDVPRQNMNTQIPPNSGLSSGNESSQKLLSVNWNNVLMSFGANVDFSTPLNFTYRENNSNEVSRAKKSWIVNWNQNNDDLFTIRSGDATKDNQTIVKDGFASDSTETLSFLPDYTNSPLLDDSPWLQYDRGALSTKVRAALLQKQINIPKLAMRRAYPSYRIFIIDEDNIYNKTYVELDEIYTYNKIQSIQITESRKRPASVCIITFNDSNGILSGYNQFNSAATAETIAPSKEPSPNNRTNPIFNGTPQEQNLNTFVLSAGQKIKIKIGYSNDSNKLEEVFLGEVSTVEPGESNSIQVVCLGYGAELVANKLGTTTEETVDITYNTTFDLLANSMFQPSILHFGQRKFGLVSYFGEDQSLSQSAINYKQGFGSSFLYDQYRIGKLRGGFWHNLLGGMSKYHGTITTAGSAIAGAGTAVLLAGAGSLLSYFALPIGIAVGTGLAITGNSDILRDWFMQAWGSISTEKAGYQLNVDLEKKGPQDDNIFAPNYSADNITSLWDRNFLFPNTDNDKTIRKFTDANGNEITVRSYKQEDLKYNVFQSTAWDLFEEMTLRHPGYVKHPRIYSNSNRMTMYFGLPDQHYWDRASDPLLTYKANSIFRHILETDVDPLNDINHTTAGTRHLTAQDRHADNHSYMAQDYESLDGKGHILENEALKDLQNFFKYVAHRYHPFRRWHHLNSFTDIISNNIEATSEGWATEVTVQYGDSSTSEELSEGETKDLYDPNNTVTRKASLDLSPKNIRNSTFQFPSCKGRSFALNYAQALLAKENKEMYKGSLLLLGDSKIRPYDVCILNDTYNGISGPIEVEEIIHTISPETGFVTEIIPDTFNVLEDFTPISLYVSLLPTVGFRTERYAFNTMDYFPLFGDIYAAGTNGITLLDEYQKLYSQILTNQETFKREIDNILNLGIDILKNPDRDGYPNNARQIGGTLIGLGAAAKIASASGLTESLTGVTGTVVGGLSAAWIPLIAGGAAIIAGGLYLNNKITNFVLNYMGDNRSYVMIPLIKNGIPFTAGIDTGYAGFLYKTPQDYIRQYIKDSSKGLDLRETDLLMEQNRLHDQFGQDLDAWTKIELDARYISYLYDNQWDIWGTKLLQNTISPLPISSGNIPPLAVGP